MLVISGEVTDLPANDTAPENLIREGVRSVTKTVSPPDDRLLTAKEAAEYLRLPVNTLHVWRVRKEGPPVLRAGRSLRYRRSTLDAWLARDDVA